MSTSISSKDRFLVVETFLIVVFAFSIASASPKVDGFGGCLEIDPEFSLIGNPVEVEDIGTEAADIDAGGDADSGVLRLRRAGSISSSLKGS
jgi:uncharacterized protein YwlG (UPF0340 family)